jgi:hypothetical protein
MSSSSLTSRWLQKSEYGHDVTFILLPLTQAALQNFAWTEQSRERIKAERAAQCSTDVQREAALAEPVFCFETACKALYWSILVYRIQARLLD